MSEPNIYLNKEVRVKKNQGKIGGDIYPGRHGIIVKVHPFDVPALFFYVRLKPTNRAKERVHTFFISDLIFIDDELNGPVKP